MRIAIRNIGFISCSANLEGVVRVATCSALMHPGSTGVYARAHACVAASIDYHKSKVVDLCPNWFFDNWLGVAGEAKSAGTITYPAHGMFKAG